MESPLETGQENTKPITTDALVSPGKGEKYLWTKRATRHKPEYLDYTGGTANETHLAFTRPQNHTFLLEHKRLLVVAAVVVVIVVVVGAVVGGVLVSNKTEPQVSSTRTTVNPGTSSKSNLLTDLTSKSQPSSTSSISTEPPTSSISQTRASPSASSSTSSTTTVSTTSSASAVSSSSQSTTSPSTSTTSLLTSPVSTTTSTSAASPSSTFSTSTSISQSSTTAISSTTTITTSTVTTTTSSLPYLSMLDVTFNDGEDDLYLLCTISDDSKIIKVLFYKDGVQLKDDFIIGIHGRECSLTKKGATCSDSGDYECRVSGEFGTIKTTSTVNILVEPSKPTLKIKKIKLIDDAWEATLSCERRLGQPATSLHWRVLFNTGDIRENIFGAQSNTTTQEGCSSPVISQVTQQFMRSWDGAEICCYLTDAGGMTLNLEGCDVFTYTTDVSPCDCTAGRVAVPRPTTYPDNCSLYYTCSGGVKQDATCTGSDIFSADPSKQACTAIPGDSYCAKVKANEVKVCTTTSK